MSNKLIFNIGLNVGNNQPADQLNRTMFKLIDLGAVKDITVRVGHYNDQPESTVIAWVESSGSSIGAIINAVRLMAYELEQDAIAVEINGVGHLIYRHDWDEVQYPFNAQYFLK